MQTRAAFVRSTSRGAAALISFGWYDGAAAGARGANHPPSVRRPTSLDANAALPYGGVWSTERPEAANVRTRIGGSVKLGRWGRTWRNVAGGMSAAVERESQPCTVRPG